MVPDIENEQPRVYDDTTILMLEKRCEDMRSGKEKTFTLEQTIANLNDHRKCTKKV